MKNNKIKLFFILSIISFVFFSCSKNDSKINLNSNNWDATYQIIGSGNFFVEIKFLNSIGNYSNYRENVTAPWSTTLSYDKGNDYNVYITRKDDLTDKFYLKMTVKNTLFRYDSAYGGNATITFSGILQ